MPLQYSLPTQLLLHVLEFAPPAAAVRVALCSRACFGSVEQALQARFSGARPEAVRGPGQSLLFAYGAAAAVERTGVRLVACRPLAHDHMLLIAAATGARLAPATDPHTVMYSLPTPHRVVAVAAAGQACALLDAAGVMYTWGCGDHGVLGHGDDLHRSHPTRVAALDDMLGVGDRVVQVCLAESHAAAVTLRGRVFMWGSNSAGQLGMGDKRPPSALPLALSPTPLLVMLTAAILQANVRCRASRSMPACTACRRPPLHPSTQFCSHGACL